MISKLFLAFFLIWCFICIINASLYLFGFKDIKELDAKDAFEAYFEIWIAPIRIIQKLIKRK